MLCNSCHCQERFSLNFVQCSSHLFYLVFFIMLLFLLLIPQPPSSHYGLRTNYSVCNSRLTAVIKCFDLNSPIPFYSKISILCDSNWIEAVTGLTFVQNGLESFLGVIASVQAKWCMECIFSGFNQVENFDKFQKTTMEGETCLGTLKYFCFLYFVSSKVFCERTLSDSNIYFLLICQGSLVSVLIPSIRNYERNQTISPLNMKLSTYE